MQTKKIDIGNTLSAINIKGGQELYLSYIDYFRLFLKIIMLLSFVSLLYIACIRKYLTND